MKVSVEMFSGESNLTKAIRSPPKTTLATSVIL